jgi:type IV pilus assembly protein PilM
MLDFLNLHPEAFGLDISDLSLKIVKLKKKRGVFALSSFGETPMKSGIIEKGEIRNEKFLAEIIKKAITNVKGEKIISKYVVASLPEEKAFLQVIQMPGMPEGKLKKAVYFEAENYIPISINDVYLDSHIVSRPNKYSPYFEIFIAAMPKKIVDSYAALLSKAGLIPKALEIESQAINRALIKDEFSAAPLLLIDLGLTRTSFIISSGSSLRFTSSISVSSCDVTDAIAKSLGISFEKAEELKLKYGISKDITGAEIFKAMLPVLNGLTEQIKKHLSYCRSHLDNKDNIIKVILCGGGANLYGLCNFCSTKLKLPVEIGNPWINIGKNPPELPLQESLKYTTAIGLALRGITNQ